MTLGGQIQWQNGAGCLQGLQKDCSPGRRPELINVICHAVSCVAVSGSKPLPCYHPITATKSLKKKANGRHSISFSTGDGQPVQLPCGQCVGCRLERSRTWAIRCLHESSLYQNNSFVTLTYDNKNLPHDHGLHKPDFQNFMKRLRKHFPQRIRFYHCGEYGEKLGRPHYHALLFNCDFPDKKLIKQGEIEEHNLYESPTLNRLWGLGLTSIGQVTFESAAYVARYCMKKVTGEQAEHHYTVVDPSTGEVHQRLAEYTTMSRRPGIGKLWYDRYKKDCFPSDFITVKGIKMKPPKFYLDHLEKENPDLVEHIKNKRVISAIDSPDNSTERLVVREKVKQAQLSQIKRSI